MTAPYAAGIFRGRVSNRPRHPSRPPNRFNRSSPGEECSPQCRSVVLLAGMTLACTASVVAPPSVGAQIGVQRERNAPAVYAITNARIVTVAGPAIDRGTIVVRNGVIAAVGASVARSGRRARHRRERAHGLSRLDRRELAASASHAKRRAARQSRRGSWRTRGRRPRRSTDAAGRARGRAELAPSDRTPARARGGRSRAPGRRSIRGAAERRHHRRAHRAGDRHLPRTLGAVINLGGSNAQAMIVKAPVAEHIGFTPLRGGGYPNSLLGVFSALRQMLLDAQHYARRAGGVREESARHASARDRSVARGAAAGARAADAGRDGGVVGARDRARARPREGVQPPARSSPAAKKPTRSRRGSRRRTCRCCISLNFPRRPQASADADPEPIRVLRARVEAPKLAAKLAQAGVKFAFEDGGITNWADFLANAGRTRRRRAHGRPGGARADAVAGRDLRRERSSRHDRGGQDREPDADARRSVHAAA